MSWARNAVLFGVTVVVAFVAGRVFQSLHPFATVSFNESLNCTLLAADRLVDAEDLILWTHGRVIVSAGDVARVMGWGRFSPDGRPLDADAVSGKIFCLDISSNSVDELPLHGIPDGLPFQPHGIYASNATHRLYAVSHGMGAGGSRVMVFDIVEDPQSHALSLHFVRSIASPLMHNMGPNDVVEAGAHEILVTIFMVSPTPITGRRYPVSWRDRWQGFLATTGFLATPFHPPSRILRCSWSEDAALDAGARCTVAATGALAYNGITITPDRKHVHVADSFGRVIYHYRRTATGDLEEEGTTPLQYIPDNVDYDVASGCLTVGSIADGVAAYFRMTASTRAAQHAVTVAGGMDVLCRDGTSSWRLDLSRRVMHDGKLLSQTSSGLMYGATTAMGSPTAPGVLVCRPS